MTFAQLAGIAPAVTVESIAIGFTGMVMIGFWREQRGLREDMRTWQAKIDTTLFGPNGDNGLNGCTKDHEHRLRDLENRTRDNRLHAIENNERDKRISVIEQHDRDRDREKH